jgi:hypothetical protein
MYIGSMEGCSVPGMNVPHLTRLHSLPLGVLPMQAAPRPLVGPPSEVVDEGLSYVRFFSRDQELKGGNCGVCSLRCAARRRSGKWERGVASSVGG